MKPLPVFFACLVLVAFLQCKKKRPVPVADTKSITAFILRVADNPALASDVYGVITDDTIFIKLVQGIPLQNLVPTISHTGVGINPASGTPQNFSQLVYYTVTAQNGSTRKYVVKASYLSNKKEITSFVLRASDNPGLGADLAGVIRSDTIRIILQSDIPLTGLVPAIVHTGKNINPTGSTAQDFSNLVKYTVVAEDGSTRTYTVIISLNMAVYIGSDDSYLYALDAGTGNLLWKQATGGAIRSSPTLHNGIVYVGSMDQYLYAFDAVSGAVKWKYWSLGSISSSPTVDHGIVYVACNNSDLIAVDAENGTFKWKYDLWSYFTHSSPTVANGTVYIGLGNGGGIAAIDAVTGVHKWRHGSGISPGTPLVKNGILYAGGETSKLFALDAVTGAGKWSYVDGNFGSLSGPAIHEGMAWIGASEQYLYAFDISNGSFKWKFESNGHKLIGDNRTGMFSGPVYYKGVVYAGNNDSYLYAIDAVTGIKKWQFGDAVRTTAEINNPTVANGYVYVGSHDRSIYALHAQTGIVKWKYETGGSVYSGPCVVDAKGKAWLPGVSGDKE